MALAQQNDLFGIAATKPAPQQQQKPTESPLDFLRRTEVQAMHKLQRELPAAAAMAESIVVDPGADIHPDDSELWLMLLSQARKVDKNLQAILAYLRGGGAKLVDSNRFGYAIVAIIDPSGVNGWPSQEFYNQEKRYIGEHGEKLKELLWQLRNPKPTQYK